jgi:hypothetical protein
MSFLPTELPTELIILVKLLVNCSLLPDTVHHVNYKGNHQQKIQSVFSESTGTIHFIIALLIIVLYRRKYRRIEKSSMLFGKFLKIFE